MARKTGSNGEKTARELRVAALSLFAEHGYAAVSMRQIARKVGVQVGALYRYTPDKQALLFDMMRDHLQALLDAWAEAERAAAPNPRAQLEAFVRFHIEYHVTRVDAVFASNMELRNLSPENFVAIEKLRRAYEAVVENILAQGEADVVFTLMDRRVASLALIAMLTGVNRWYRAGGRLGIREIEDNYLHMVKGMVGWHP